MAMYVKFDCCYKCEKRVLGCHSTCSEYLNKIKENDEIKAKIHADKDPATNYTDIHNVEYSTPKSKGKGRQVRYNKYNNI